MSQLDMFDPPHVAFKKEAEHNYALAAPYLAKALAAENKANELCPHETIIVDVEYHEDEYGKTMESWTTYEMSCTFCKKYRTVNRDKANRSGKSVEQIFLEGI